MTTDKLDLAADEEIAILLQKRGKLDDASFARVLRWHKETGQNIEAVATSLGLVSERDMAEAVSEYLALPLLRRADYPRQIILEGELNPRFLKSARVLPIGEEDGRVILAMAQPRDANILQAVSLRLSKPVVPRVAVPSELEEALQELLDEKRSPLSQIVEGLEVESGDGEEDAEKLRSLASDAPVIRLVNHLINKAVEAKASDIHVEAFESRLRVRMRVDGVLQEIESPPSGLRFAIISRIKIMARMNIAERRLPQDGRIRLVVRGTEVDIRVSTVPTIHGEGVVLRILDKSRGVRSFDELGFDSSYIGHYVEMLERPNGIVLVTGPTGSGKTTTLYASLLHLNKTDRKIITVEDPVEYQLYGINQIQVHPQIGLTFASILRSILRQDPDIILIGEIRDLETAQIAVQAALTGHLVLSTVHTNSAASTIARLIDMGVEDYLLNSTLVGVVAQRLVRVLCGACKAPYSTPSKVFEQYGLMRLIESRTSSLYRATGCAQCQNTGYSGRISIAEVLPIDEQLKACIVKGAHTHAIHKEALAQGMQSMLEDGLRKVVAGVTTVEEVLRATREV